MGFMDKMKDAAAQAQDAAKQAASQMSSGSGGAADQAATAAQMNKLATSGVETPATLKDLRDTGNKDALSGGTDYEIDVEVQPEGGEAYAATFTQQLIPQSVEGFKEKVGQDVTVKVDPDDPSSMVLWG
jgi:hypothetical protein